MDGLAMRMLGLQLRFFINKKQKSMYLENKLYGNHVLKERNPYKQSIIAIDSSKIFLLFEAKSYIDLL